MLLPIHELGCMNLPLDVGELQEEMRIENVEKSAHLETDNASQDL